MRLGWKSSLAVTKRVVYNTNIFEIDLYQSSSGLNNCIRNLPVVGLGISYNLITWLSLGRTLSNPALKINIYGW